MDLRLFEKDCSTCLFGHAHGDTNQNIHHNSRCCQEITVIPSQSKNIMFMPNPIYSWLTTQELSEFDVKSCPKKCHQLHNNYAIVIISLHVHDNCTRALYPNRSPTFLDCLLTESDSLRYGSMSRRWIYGLIYCAHVTPVEFSQAFSVANWSTGKNNSTVESST